MMDGCGMVDNHEVDAHEKMDDHEVADDHEVDSHEVDDDHGRFKGQE